MQNKPLFKLNQLVQTLNDASEKYYNGKEEMTNKEFDEKFDELRKMEEELGVVLPNSPTHNVGADAVSNLPKFKHTVPALSLDKTKDVKELKKRFEEGIHNSNSIFLDELVIMWKEDGSTVQAYYNNGKLDKLVTRGNGEVGNVITHNAAGIEGLPLEIAYKGQLIVRGEAVMSYEEFERINSDLPVDLQYKNPRNLAAATLTMLDPKEASQRHLTLKAFSLVYAEDEAELSELASQSSRDLNIEGSFEDRLKALNNLGFLTVERQVVHLHELEHGIELMSSLVETYPFPVDGLVVAMDNYAYAKLLPGTGHHPNVMLGYAFKWSDESAETVLREIEWSPSRTGLLNPVAIFDPVELEGTTVTRASLHNLSIMRGMRIHVGDRLSVCKSNKIIPYIEKNLDVKTEQEYTWDFVHDLIGFCPTCGSPAAVYTSPEGIETVYCPNEECPEKMIGNLAHFCERDCMDIQGMSEETIKKLVDAGFIKEYADFFKLADKPQIASLPGFGEVSWRNMCEAAEAARTTDFVKFITALSIPNIGKGQARALLTYISNNYDDLCDLVGVDKDTYAPVSMLRLMRQFGFDFIAIDGFGPILASGLSKWLRERFAAGVISPELRVYDLLTFTDERLSTNASSPVAGRSFCITGKLIHFSNRQELVDLIRANGGNWIDSVSSKTDYLINNDVTSASGKNKKAHELNIPIISEDDFMKMLGSD